MTVPWKNCLQRAGAMAELLQPRWNYAPCPVVRASKRGFFCHSGEPVQFPQTVWQNLSFRWEATNFRNRSKVCSCETNVERMRTLGKSKTAVGVETADYSGN